MLKAVLDQQMNRSIQMIPMSKCYAIKSDQDISQKTSQKTSHFLRNVFDIKSHVSWDWFLFEFIVQSYTRQVEILNEKFVKLET